MNEKTSRGRRIFQIIALFFFLVVFPAGSWYYLQKGFKEHKSTLDELTEAGSHPTLQVVKENKPHLMKADSGSIRVSAFIDPGRETGQTEKIFFLYDKLHTQFDIRDDVELNIYNLGELEGKPDTGRFTFLQDTAQVHLFDASNYSPREISELFYIPDTLSWDETFVLSDLNGQVRNFYRYENENRMKMMVKQIALLLPRRKFNSPTIKRETEK